MALVIVAFNALLLWAFCAHAGQATLPPADKAALICEAAGLSETCALSAHRGTRRSLRITIGTVGTDVVVVSQLGHMFAAFIPSDVVSNALLLDEGWIKLALTEKMLTVEQAHAAAIALRVPLEQTIAYLDRPRAIRPVDNQLLGLGNAVTVRIDLQFVRP